MVNSQLSVFLFIGRDSYSKEEAVKRLGASFLDSSSRELDYKVFDASDTQMREILDYVTTVPFLAAKRLAIIKNIEELSSEDTTRLINYIKDPMKTTCLVLDAVDDSLVKEYPAIMRHISLRRFGGLDDLQFRSRAKEMLSSLGSGKEISTDAAKALKELCGEDMGSVAQELQKISSYVGERGRIDLKDVEELSGKNISASAFDLTDAIEASDLKGALSIISELTLSGKKHYEIVGLLCWQMKRLFKGRVLLEKGTPDSQIANTVKVARQYQEKFIKQLKAFRLADIESKMRILLETDLDIKRTKYDPALALEFAVIRLCLGLR